MIDHLKRHVLNACSNQLTICISRTPCIGNILMRKIISMLGCSAHWHLKRALERVQRIVYKSST